ncbi:TIGR02530 family flagellar biosynthesis protein [Paratissierella segnis]|jgi:flagellar operon protein|uniref:Flagellar protein n=1 Tax=Paratissierella segnis TaxID=2763679 RepID=A0A926EVM0_9FIRM|nr:TIGR02530 family flagellar biosynthesis protein [Paratissierella segnis]MBC8588332.1 hypothetical protein [Paratissierella segnis]
MNFRVERGQVIPVKNGASKETNAPSSLDFQKILQESLIKDEKIKISQHAKQRMLERNIKLKESDMNTLNQAMNNLEQKGARESLMLYKDLALIASVNNRTIITALQSDEMEIVTNIDSAVIIR